MNPMNPMLKNAADITGIVIARVIFYAEVYVAVCAMGSILIIPYAKLFGTTPNWSHVWVLCTELLPMVVAYGMFNLLQRFLEKDTSNSTKEK